MRQRGREGVWKRGRGGGTRGNETREESGEWGTEEREKGRESDIDRET